MRSLKPQPLALKLIERGIGTLGAQIVIVVSLMGGLGNQMFQYAFGRGASTALNRRLVLDAFGLPSGAPPHQRRYELGCLPLNAQVTSIGTTGHDSATSPTVRLGKGLRATALRVLPGAILHEEGLDSRLAFDRIPQGIAVLRGYWQSPLYFSALADIIRGELTPEFEIGGNCDQLLQKFVGNETILVHVRRGDYVSVSEARYFHGLVSPAYYEGAVAAIAASTPQPVAAIVVSDDPVWAEENLRLGIPTAHAELEASLSHFEILALMSKCRHHIIANSSFSWWGAWLAERPGQQVIYPERWFHKLATDPSFRFPGHWQAFTSKGLPAPSHFFG